MRKHVMVAGIVGSMLVLSAALSQAASWVQTSSKSNKVVETVYYDETSVKAQGKTVSWTEKYLFTPGSSQFNTKHLAQYPVCKKGIEKKGEVTHAEMDFEMKGDKYRCTAIRNFNKKNELICTNKDMGEEVDTNWQDLLRNTAKYDMYYLFVSKHNLGALFE